MDHLTAPPPPPSRSIQFSNCHYSHLLLLFHPTSPANTPWVWLLALCILFCFVFFFLGAVLVSLARSTRTVSVPHLRQTDRHERLHCQDVSLQDPAGAQNTRAQTHNQRGKTGVGPQSERPLQNQLAFKLMKRVMKRGLSLLQKADRQASGLL